MIKITADSTCDLPPDIVKEFDISIIPLYIVVGDKSFQDGVNITPSEIFNYVDNENKTCKTTAINIHDYQRIFQDLSSKYEAVIHISLSKHLSSCYQNAILAAQNFTNVYVIDSENLSTGSGQIVYDAALMAREGLKTDEICRKLDEIIPKVETSFVIDRLDYLRKGGRCSALAALGANMLQIKPSIYVIDGKMTVGKKYRGSFKRCLKNYVKDKLDNRKDIDYSRLFITNASCSPEVINTVKEAVNQYADFKEIIVNEAGSTISNHCGPNTLGIIFKRK